MLNLISEALKKRNAVAHRQANAEKSQKGKPNEKIMSLGSGEKQRLSKTLSRTNRRASQG